MPKSTRVKPLPADSRAAATRIDALQRQLANVDRRLGELRRFAELGTAFATLAHEVRNLMTPIVGFAGYALGHDDPDLLRKALESAHRNAMAAAELAERLLNAGAGGASTVNEATIAQAAADAIALLQADARETRHDIQIDIPDGLRAGINLADLRQVLFNLLLNSTQALNKHAGRICITARETGNRAVIEVSDSGCGVLPADLPHLFEPFYSSRRADTHESSAGKSGAGLGLSACRRLISQAGGSIAIESTPGQGTTVTINLPMVAASQSIQRSAPRARH